MCNMVGKLEEKLSYIQSPHADTLSTTGPNAIASDLLAPTTRTSLCNPGFKLFALDFRDLTMRTLGRRAIAI